jgi:hypothetical protein
MTVPILRTSERGTFGRCPQQWWWSWREGLVPKGRADLRLWFGGLVHVALAEWYCGPGLKRGPHPAETFARLAEEERGLAFVKTKDATDEEMAEYTDAIDLGTGMLNGYVERYGRDDYMHVVAPERTFGIDVPWPQERQGVYDVEPGALLVQYFGTWDLVYRDLRTDWMMLGEHKTAKSIQTGHLKMDNQAGSYWAIATQSLRREGVLGDKESLRGIEYNFLRKGLPDDRPRDAEGYATNLPVKADYLAALRESGHRGADLDKAPMGLLSQIALKSRLTVLGARSKVQPPALFLRHTVHRTSKERATQLRRIQDEAVHMQTVRDGLLPVTLNPSSMNCMFCPHKTMCELKEEGGNWEDFKRLNYRVKDPYGDHRKSAAEE